MRLVAAFILVLLAAAPVAAVPVRFSCVTNNNAADCATGEAQILVDVRDIGSNRISMVVTNLGPNQSSITDVYVDDGTIVGLASVVNFTGVEFEQWADPFNLPGGALINPPFETTKGFSADANSPRGSLGVNPGEQLALIFELLPGLNFGDTLIALAQGDLRIGLQLTAFSTSECEYQNHPCGGQESFVNRPVQVPEPGTLAVIGLGLVALGTVVSRNRRRPSRD